MSKSVSDRKNAAAIGTRNRTAIAARPGASSIHAARASCAAAGGWPASPATAGLCARQHPAPFLQHAIHIAVERGQADADRLAAPDGGLQILGHFLRDLLPLGHARHGLDPRELDSEGPGLHVVGKRRILPGLPDRKSTRL